MKDFNWEELEGDENETPAKHSEYEKMYSDTLSTIAENEVIDGKVISMNKREVVINIGYKSEGVISLSEFRYDPDLKVGDTVEV
ncbi:MAG: S1 RNA-binding domain-containing protein, partial [Bacteroidales bacterium]